MTNTPSKNPCLGRRVGSTLLALGIAVGALAATATPADAASIVFGCFHRLATDPAGYLVRVDLRVLNPYTKVWQQTGQWQWISLRNTNVESYVTETGTVYSPPTLACVTFNVPAAYQNFDTTLVVDHVMTQNQTSVAYFGSSGVATKAGTQTGILWPSGPVFINNLSSPYPYWH